MAQFTPLTRDEVNAVITGRGNSSRVPILLKMWVHPEEFHERQSQVEEILSRYPEDIQLLSLNMPGVFDAPPDDPDYRWVNRANPYAGQSVALDERIAIRDWDELDDILAHFPDPHYPGLTLNLKQDGPLNGRYRACHWWYSLFERFWDLRGMTHALVDFYDHPQQVHRLFRALTDFYLVVIERSKYELNADGIITSDDIGTQVNTFFSLKIFREFFKPYYRELVEKAHSLDMHFWLHTCGNIEPFLPEFIEMGLDVIHPIQKYAMDQVQIAKKFGGKITFWVGLDVQQVIPWGTPDEVRREVRTLMDAFWRPGEGRMVISAGNGINGDCPLDSLEALVDEAARYGSQKPYQIVSGK